MLKSLRKKEIGEYFFVGDIHGNFTKLANSLAYIGFSPKYDTLVCVGDLVDRGPESIDVLKFLRYPFVRSVMGNHEVFAIQYAGEHNKCPFPIHPTDYIRWGGEWFINASKQMQQKIAAKLSKLPIAIEVHTPDGVIGVVHANIPNSWADMRERLLGNNPIRRDTIIDWCQWDRSRFNIEDADIIPDLRALIVGHSPVPKITQFGNRLYIDTNSSRSGGHFTFIRGSDLQAITVTPDDLEQRRQTGIYKTMSELWG